MQRFIQCTLCFLLIFAIVFGSTPTFGRGGRGGGGGGGSRGGGGYRGGGGRSVSRPSVSRSPSVSRPASRPATRPSGSRPSTGTSRPSVGARPSTPVRTSPGITPGSRPGTVDFNRPTTRPSTPSVGTRPTNPSIGTRPSTPSIGKIGAGAALGAATLPGLGNRPDIGARPSQLPARTPQQRHNDLQNRLSSRDQVRDRADIHDDWHDRYDDFYDRHDDWHHGHWHGNAGDWWHHMWDDHTAMMVFGTTMWGINRAAYGFGYWGYENPYYVETYPVSDDVVLDYSQPLEVETAPADASASETASPGMADFDAARAAFYKGNYEAALASTNKALAALPQDPIIHEFRALVMFAQGKYDEAAAGLHSVLAVGPGWDWTTLASLYPSVDVYTQQLRALEAAVKAEPTALDRRFVLAYHYVTTGNKDAAVNQLKQLLAKTPEDTVVKELLLMTGGPEALGVEPTTTETAPATPAVKAVDLQGTWTAAGEGSKFTLLMNNEGLFSWKFERDGKVEAVKGVYALDGNVLALEPESGGVMLAEVTPPTGGSFNFKMIGAPPGDAGLTFAKSR